MGTKSGALLRQNHRSGKILADSDKISVVEGMKPPKTQREVRRILGFFGYFRDQIPNYAEIGKPLTDLTTKRYRTRILWEASQQSAFDQLKLALKRATENSLYPLDLSRPLHLFIDASSYSVSGALTQVDDNGKHLPVAFVSTKLTETQRQWSVIEREAFLTNCISKEIQTMGTGYCCLCVLRP